MWFDLVSLKALRRSKITKFCSLKVDLCLLYTLKPKILFFCFSFTFVYSILSMSNFYFHIVKCYLLSLFFSCLLLLQRKIWLYIVPKLIIYIYNTVYVLELLFIYWFSAIHYLDEKIQYFFFLSISNIHSFIFLSYFLLFVYYLLIFMYSTSNFFFFLKEKFNDLFIFV